MIMSASTPSKQSRGPSKTPTQRLAHLAQVAEALLKGRSRKEIAAELGVTPPQITYDKKQLERLWLEKAKKDIGLVKARELARIDLMEYELWNAWNKSWEDEDTRTEVTQAIEPDEKSVEDKHTDEQREAQAHVVKRTTCKRGRLPDVRYMESIQWCVEQRLKLCGIDGGTPFNASMLMNMSQANVPNNIGIFMNETLFQECMKKLTPAERKEYMDDYIRLSKAARSFMERLIEAPTRITAEGEEGSEADAPISWYYQDDLETENPQPTQSSNDHSNPNQQ